MGVAVGVITGVSVTKVVAVDVTVTIGVGVIGVVVTEIGGVAVAGTVAVGETVFVIVGVTVIAVAVGETVMVIVGLTGTTVVLVRIAVGAWAGAGMAVSGGTGVKARSSIGTRSRPRSRWGGISTGWYLLYSGGWAGWGKNWRRSPINKSIRARPTAQRAAQCSKIALRPTSPSRKGDGRPRAVLTLIML